MCLCVSVRKEARERCMLACIYARKCVCVRVRLFNKTSPLPTKVQIQMKTSVNFFRCMSLRILYKETYSTKPDPPLRP